MAIAALAVARAWADHDAGLRSPAMNPAVVALLWAGAALVVGMAVIAIVTVVARRRSSEPHDG